jgi:hypothetical protein
VWAVEQGAAGDVDEPGAWAHGPKHGVVDEGRLAGLITRFELALADHLHHGAADETGGPVPRHLGPGVIF